MEASSLEDKKIRSEIFSNYLQSTAAAVAAVAAIIGALALDNVVSAYAAGVTDDVEVPKAHAESIPNKVN